MKKLRLLLAVILSSAFFYGCKKDKGDDATGKLETILTANAVVIEQAQQNDVLSTSENQIVLQAGSVTAGNAEVGSVLASGITANAPYGFLRKVVSKQTVGNTVVLSTEPASLDEFFEQADIEFHTTLTATDSMNKTTGGAFTFTMPEAILYDQDGNSGTTTDQVKGQGQISLEVVDYTFVYRKKKGSLAPEKAELSFQVKDNSGFTLDANLLSLGIDTARVLKKWPLKPSTIYVPIFGVPIPMIVFKNDLVLKTRYFVNGKFIYSFTNNVTYRMGMKYDDGVWKAVYETIPGASGEDPRKADFNYQVNAGLFAILDIESRPYGTEIFKTEVGGSVGLKGGVDITRDPDYIFSIGGDVHAIGSSKFFGKEFSPLNLTYTFNDWEFKKGNFADTNILDGVWTMDFDLASSGDCDENTLEDEDGIPPTFHFNPNGTITFDYCYVVDIAYLNNPSITTTSYTFANDTLKFSVIESDQGDFHETKGVLLYNQTTNRFTGTYSWKSWYMGNLSNDCSNTISIYK